MPNSASRFGRLGWLVLSLLVLVIDQVSKAHFEGTLEMFQQIVVIPDYFSWTLAYNTGADVRLPGSDLTVGFFMYPQGETANGRLDSLDPTNFAYSIHSRKLV